MPLGHPHFAKLFPCACTLAAREQQATTARRAQLEQLASELGETLAHCQLDTYNPERPNDPNMLPEERTSLRRALRAARAYAADPRDWLYFYGPVGTGKSHLAAAIGYALAERGMDVYYRSVPDLVDALRAGFQAGDYDARLEAIKDVAVLVLDDLGTENPTENTAQLLFQIINYRANRPTLTLITSNVMLSELAQSNPKTRQQYERIASRIGGRAREIGVIASDYRRLKR